MTDKAPTTAETTADRIITKLDQLQCELDEIADLLDERPNHATLFQVVAVWAAVAVFGVMLGRLLYHVFG